MEQYSNREIVMQALGKEHIKTIPAFIVGNAYVMTHTNVDPQMYQKDKGVFVQANIDFRKEYGTCINYAGGYMDVPGIIAGGLSNSEGDISKSGEDTIHSIEDFNKLRKFDIGSSRMLEAAVGRIQEYKKLDPDTPIIAIVDNSAMVTSVLVGASTYYRCLMRNKEFIHKLTELVEPMIMSGLEKLAEVGCDIIWFPMPTMGGTCISKKLYTELCHPYSAKMVECVRNLGMKAIIHTCGDWNDRFDVVLEEKPDAIHLSQAIMSDFAKTYGNQVCMMGNISVVDTLLYKNQDEIYAECVQECETACQYGNYMIGPDCGAPAALKVENVKAMYRAGKDVSAKL